MLLMAVGFAAFSQRLQINGTSNITSNWDIEITNIRAVNLGSVESNGAYDINEPTIGTDKLSASFNTGLISPGDTRIYEIEVTNQGSLNAEVSTVFTNTLSDSVHFSYDGVGPLGGSGTDILTNGGVYNTNNLDKQEPFSLPANTNNVRYIYMTVKYRDSVTSQPSNLMASINLKLNAVQSSGTVTPSSPGLQTIHAAGVDFPVASSGDGLYYDENTGEYYFKGTNPNNYIEFSGDVWRIMSISPQGNLKIIKEDVIDLSNYSGVNPEGNTGRFDKEGRRTTGYCSQGSAVPYGCNAWAAMNNFSNFMSLTGDVVEDSELNIFLNTTYKSELSSLNFVQTGMTWNVGHASSHNDRNNVKELQNMEKNFTWVGDIALPTKSEYIRAHGNLNCSNAKYLSDNYQNDTCKSTNYLFKSDSIYYWLLSPASSTHLVLQQVYGSFTSKMSNRYSYVRPALYLKSNITLTGDGTNDGNIYRIS